MTAGSLSGAGPLIFARKKSDNITIGPGVGMSFQVYALADGGEPDPKSGGASQQPTRPRFAVAIPDSGTSQTPHYDPLSESGEYFTYLDCSKFPHARSWDAAHPKERRPSTIELGFAVAGDNLLIMATAYYGDKFGGSVSTARLRAGFA